MNEYEKRRKGNEKFVRLKLPRHVVDRARSEFSCAELRSEAATALVQAVIEASASKKIDQDQDWVVVHGDGFTRKGDVEVACLRAVDCKWWSWMIEPSWDKIRNRSIDGGPLYLVRFPNREKAEVLLSQVRELYPDAYIRAIPKRRRK